MERQALSALAGSNRLAYAVRVNSLYFKLLSRFHCRIACVLAMALSACSDAPESSAIEEHGLLQKVLANPGVDLWLGDDSVGIGRKVVIDKFPLYTIDHERYAVSGEHLSQLRAVRNDSLAQLKPMIEAATKAAMSLPTAETVVPSLETELTIALDLNAVELLDLLAGSCMQLQTFLRSYEEGGLETYPATSHARLHRNLLGAISGILKQEAFAPVVNEEWDSEFTFEKAQGTTGAFNLLDEGVFADESAPDMPVGGLAPFTSRFSEQIIDWAREFLEDTPVNQRNAASGMEHPVPTLR